MRKIAIISSLVILAGCAGDPPAIIHQTKTVMPDLALELLNCPDPGPAPQSTKDRPLAQSDVAIYANKVDLALTTCQNNVDGFKAYVGRLQKLYPPAGSDQTVPQTDGK